MKEAGLYSVTLEVSREVTLHTVYCCGSDYFEHDVPALDTTGSVLFSLQNEPSLFLKSFDRIPYELPLPCYTYSVPRVVDIVTRKTRDSRHDVVDMIIFLLDVVDALPPKKNLSAHMLYKTLVKIQLSLTMNTLIDDFLEGSGYSRDDMQDALYWALGVIIGNCKLV